MEPLLYEVNTRVWLGELRERHGAGLTLAKVPDSELDSWARCGVTHLWLMGVWTSGTGARACARESGWLREELGRLFSDPGDETLTASPYAVAEYEPATELGGAPALQAFRQRLNSLGIKLVLDFVPNHLGVDHPWARQHPDRFVAGCHGTAGCVEIETKFGPRLIAHGKDPYFPAWTDTLQVDFRRAEARESIKSLLLKVAGLCDGLRCDMAMLLLRDVFPKTWAHAPPVHEPWDEEFWPEAIDCVKREHPGFLFLAEVYWGREPDLQRQGFDYTYDKELYDHLIRREAHLVQQHILRMTPQGLARGAHFIENHDESRAASIFTLAEHKAAALLILSLPGMRLLHEGQLTGARQKVPVQFLRRPAENDPAIREFYERLLLKLPSTAIGRGEWRLPPPEKAWPGNSSHESVVLVLWANESSRNLVAVNLASHPSQCLARIPQRVSPQVLDVLTGETLEVEFAGDHLKLELDPNEARLLRF